MVGRRLFVHVGGYDPVAPEQAHRRFRRELARFVATWSLRAAAGEPKLSADLAVWDVSAAGSNWSVATQVRLLRWDDVMAAEAARPRLRRFAAGLAAFSDFAVSGALVGYLRHAWRYALFFLYPFVLIAVLAALAAALGAGLGVASGNRVVGVVTAGIVFASLVALAGRRLLLNHLLDDWIFSGRYLRHGDPILGARLQRLAAELVAEATSERFDEVVVVGHSLGAVLAVDLLDRALALAPGLGLAGAPVVLATVGSSIPKIGLHRGAKRLRASLARVAAAPGLVWVEYQALTDAMNFYKTDPVRLLGAGPTGPRVRVVRISRMLERPYYRRIKRNFFRVHNQFVSANDTRYVYDYFMLACGPLPAARQAAEPEGAAFGIAPDGSFALPPSAGSARA